MVRTNAWKSATRITTAFIIDSDPDTYNFRLTYTNPSFKYVGSKCFSGPLEFNHERCYTTNTQGGSCVGSATTIRSRSFRKYHQPLHALALIACNSNQDHFTGFVFRFILRV
jgi:hypothetical protein